MYLSFMVPNENYLKTSKELAKELGVPEDVIENPPTWEQFTKEISEPVYSCHVDAIDALLYYKMNIDSIFEGEEHYKYSEVLDNLVSYFKENCVCYHK